MNPKGYTLIELMIVMGIIGLLAGLGLPGYQSYRTKTHNAVAMSELRVIAMEEVAFYNDNNLFAGFVNADIDANGNLNKPVVANGVNTAFIMRNLNTTVEATLVTDPTNQFAILATRSIRGDVIVAIEMEQAATIMKKTSVTLADVPASTGAVDLAGNGWMKW